MKENPADIAARENIEKQRRAWGKTENVLTVALSALFVIGMTLLFWILPSEDFSKTENRALEKAPTFSSETLEQGKYKYNRYAFLEGVVAYINDHFPFRNALMELNGLYDLSTGRLGSGGVILGKDGCLLYEEQPASEEQIGMLEGYADVIGELSQRIETVVAVPAKGSEIYRNRYPAVIDSSPIAENRKLINETFSGKDYVYLDLSEALMAHADEDIYYKTDHHWTPLGAYYGVCAVQKALGKTAYPLEEYRREMMLTDFRGTIYNRSGLYFLPGEELFFLRYDGDEEYTVRFLDGWGREIGNSHSLYDLSCLEEKYRGTAYDSFVAPVSTPMVHIEKQGEQRETLLVLKDSFAHSALSFLARDYDLITVDIRTGNYVYVEQLIENGTVDKLLVMVNPATLFGAE